MATETNTNNLFVALRLKFNLNCRRSLCVSAGNLNNEKVLPTVAIHAHNENLNFFLFVRRHAPDSNFPTSFCVANSASAFSSRRSGLSVDDAQKSFFSILIIVVPTEIEGKNPVTKRNC